MAIVRWDPFRTMMRWPSIWDDDEIMSPTVSDQLDIYETEGEVVVKANVAGVDDSRVDITFERGVLTITADKSEEEKQGKKYYQKATRSYSYRVAVPGNVDMRNEPEADIENGVVTVIFKKAEEAKPKKIAVKRKGK